MNSLRTNNSGDRAKGEFTEVAIIGAAGSVGQILTDRFVRAGNVVHAIDTNETELFFLEQMFGDKVKVYAGDYCNTYMTGVDEWKHCPVIHAAAYKHVGSCEKRVRAAAHNNINKFTRFLNETRIDWGVYISTDKAVEPRGVMGMTKALAEKMALEAGWNVVRFGNVWGSRGSVADLIDRLLISTDDGKEIVLPLRGGERTKRFIMHSGNVFDLVLEAVCHSSSPSVLVPNELQEDTAKSLIASYFSRSAAAMGKDVKLILEETPLNPGEKYTEKFLWPEEEDRKFDLGNGISAVYYGSDVRELTAVTATTT